MLDSEARLKELLPSSASHTQGSHRFPDATFDYLFGETGKPIITRTNASDHLPGSCDVAIQSSTGKSLRTILRRPDGARGWVSAIDSEGRTLWIVDAHRDDGRFVVHAEEKLTAFLELESAIRA
jgi:hypothetical protein